MHVLLIKWNLNHHVEVEMGPYGARAHGHNLYTKFPGVEFRQLVCFYGIWTILIIVLLTKSLNILWKLF